MSDPVSKPDIEDVLSSIRRLVSQDKLIEPHRVVSRQHRAQGKLVLTPALRVTDDSAAQDGRESWCDEINALMNGTAWPETESDSASGDQAPPPEPAASAGAEDLASASAAMPDPDATGGAGPAPEAGEQAEVFEPEPGEAETADPGASDPEAGASEEGAPWLDPGATLFASARAAGHVADAGENDEIEGAPPSDPSPSEPNEPRLHLDPTRGAPSDHDVDGSETARAADMHDPADAPHVAFPADDVIEAAEADRGSVDASDGEESAAEFERRAESLTAKIKALEEAIGRSNEQFEPDVAGADEYAGTPVEEIAWEDTDTRVTPPESGVIRGVFERDGRAPRRPRAEGATRRDASSGAGGLRGMFGPDPEAAGDPSARESAAGPAEDTDSVFDDETILDEESLRELVADIVRQELQGALGERITRNVRKLVRREIQRALAAKGLE